MITGKISLTGAVVAKDKEDLHSLVSNSSSMYPNQISGDVTITYDEKLTTILIDPFN